MINDLFPYLVVFSICIFFIFLFQKKIINVRIKKSETDTKSLSLVTYCVVGCVFLFPIITMYGLRYGIGTDYFNYESIYNVIHNSGILDYWTKHVNNVGAFYVEPGYYLLNVISPNFRALLWITGFLIFVLFLIATREYSQEISIPFALLIFLSTQYIYSMNGVRFIIAVELGLIAFVALSKDRAVVFILLILVAALFHKTALFCLSFILLRNYKHSWTNTVRNILIFVFVILFPFFIRIFFEYAKGLSIFSRYFSESLYEAKEQFDIGWMWLFHIIPVYLPLLLVCRKDIFENNDTKVYFRMCIMEVPFRILGLYNTWYTRFARYSQIVQVIFVPLVLSRINNKKIRILLYVYYVLWYVFYFGYYAIVNDQGDSLPYVWILSQI